MNVTTKEALEAARKIVSRSDVVSNAAIAQAEALTRLADLVEELVAVVRAGLAARS